MIVSSMSSSDPADGQTFQAPGELRELALKQLDRLADLHFLEPSRGGGSPARDLEAKH
jgi:hypothetical protein